MTQAGSGQRDVYVCVFWHCRVRYWAGGYPPPSQLAYCCSPSQAPSASLATAIAHTATLALLRTATGCTAVVGPALWS